MDVIRRRRRPCRHRRTMLTGDRIKLTKASGGEGRHEGHHHYISLGLVAEVEGDKVPAERQRRCRGDVRGRSLTSLSSPAGEEGAHAKHGRVRVIG